MRLYFVVIFLIISGSCGNRNYNSRKEIALNQENKIKDDSSLQNINNEPTKFILDSAKLYSAFPDELKVYININLSVLSLPSLANYYDGWYNFYDELSLPFFASGDLNGDKINDYATLLIKDNKIYLYVFLLENDKIVTHKKLNESSLSKYNNIIPIGLFIEERGVNLNLAFEEKELYLEYDALVYSIFETSSKLYYYNAPTRTFKEYAFTD